MTPTITVDLGPLEHADVGLVDALARLQLEAVRGGSTLELVHASAALRELIAFVGLDEVLRVEP